MPGNGLRTCSSIDPEHVLEPGFGTEDFEMFIAEPVLAVDELFGVQLSGEIPTELSGFFVELFSPAVSPGTERD